MALVIAHETQRNPYVRRRSPRMTTKRSIGRVFPVHTHPHKGREKEKKKEQRGMSLTMMERRKSFETYL
jgi:hypothetical protein